MNKYKICTSGKKIIYPRFYFRWKSMKYRCLNPKAVEYKRYGARGITICKEWMEYKNFHDWCEATFEEGKSIDRKNNDGPYSPENCRWATPLEQQLNSRITEARRKAIKYASTFRKPEHFFRHRDEKGRFHRKSS